MEEKITTMLEAVDAITKAAKDSNLDKEFANNMHAAEKIISEKLGISAIQSLLMALFMEHVFDDDNISINEVFEGTGCSTSRKLELMNDVDWLVDNHFFLRRTRRGESKSYSIPDDVTKAFQHNERFAHVGYKRVAPRALFYLLENLFESKDNGECSYDHLVREVDKLFEANKDMEFVG